jgi:hypothetical protein
MFKDYIQNYSPKPYKTTYAEETLKAFNYSEHSKEPEIELSYELHFHHYRFYPTHISGTFTLNGEKCPSLSPEVSPESRKWMAYRSRNFTITPYNIFYGFKTGKPFDDGNYTINARAILKNKQPVYWKFIIHDKAEDKTEIYYGPATSFEKAYAIFEKFLELDD